MIDHYVRFDTDSQQYVYAHGACDKCRDCLRLLPPDDAAQLFSNESGLMGYDDKSCPPTPVARGKWRRRCTGLWDTIKGFLMLGLC